MEKIKNFPKMPNDGICLNSVLGDLKKQLGRPKISSANFCKFLKPPFAKVLDPPLFNSYIIIFISQIFRLQAKQSSLILSARGSGFSLNLEQLYWLPSLKM